METLLDKVKKRLNIVDVKRDSEIQGYIDDITNKIFSICSRNALPTKLEYLVVKYAINCAVFYKKGYGESNKIISSISDNGQSIGYKDISILTADDVDVDKYVDKNKVEISMYAYMGC